MSEALDNIQLNEEERTEEKKTLDNAPFANNPGTDPVATVAIPDGDNPLTEESSQKIGEMLKNIESMVQIMQSQWDASARELELTDTHMKLLAGVNEKYKQNPPEHLTDEQRSDWDYLNGIDHITEEDVREIFPEGHKIYGVDHSQTVDRIKGACQDFFAWVSMMKEYRNVHDAYIKLIELEEEKQIEELKIIAEKEEDPKKKKTMEESIELYYNRKYLKWLSEPVDDLTKQRIISTLSDEKKAAYWINRCRDKLAQLKISSKFILELSQFEKRYLDEKYHKNSNVLLVYFMQTCIYMDAYNKKDDGRVKTVCMVMGIDTFIRSTMDDAHKQMILDNIIAFEDQFLDIVPEA